MQPGRSELKFLEIPYMAMPKRENYYVSANSARARAARLDSPSSA
jgi:hypothetical protein